MIDAGLVHVSTEPTREFAASIVDRDGYVLRMIGVLSLPEGSVYQADAWSGWYWFNREYFD